MHGVVEPLSRRHDRGSFDCGNQDLNVFLKQFAGQNEERGLSRTFVLAEVGAAQVTGYYSIASGAVGFQEMPERRLPRYPIPIVHLGRLAVDSRCQGQGLGEFLLMDAFRRAQLVSEQIGIYAVEVRAIDAAAREFYLKYGFTELRDDALHLYLPMSVIRRLRLY
jgi:ribosomal protein S18 acetylase RimI-like enzyme